MSCHSASAPLDTPMNGYGAPQCSAPLDTPLMNGLASCLQCSAPLDTPMNGYELPDSAQCTIRHSYERYYGELPQCSAPAIRHLL
ncbi:hypothetical protein RRG08_046677 [Elysia crispata]|uniref:Uncharacterized protein n=1 Tax=Elysia crispata TaxID=231223 RepID=A0AAE0ZX20_9GAST|nr:hypothetical protein RRG08_046677 [Elysia crispata]